MVGARSDGAVLSRADSESDDRPPTGRTEGGRSRYSTVATKPVRAFGGFFAMSLDTLVSPDKTVRVA